MGQSCASWQILGLFGSSNEAKNMIGDVLSCMAVSEGQALFGFVVQVFFLAPTTLLNF